MDSQEIFKVAAERYAICKECPLFDAAQRRCMDCGCFMLLKTKLPMVECPQHKWGKMDTAEAPAE